MNNTLKGFILIALFLLLGCAAPVKNAIYLDSEFHQRIGDNINVLPTVDLRKDKSASIDLESDIRTRFADGLKDKGYKVELLKDYGGSKDLKVEAVAEMLQDELYVLGPQDSLPILILFLNDASSKYVVMGYTYKVEVTGLLLDKQRKTVLWKDKGVGSSGQGGLISGLMAPLVKSEALSSSVNSMLMSFPNKTTANK
jgi:hypothetical protein